MLEKIEGVSNEQVAAMIGDRTSSLIETTYGALPEVWSGGEPMDWMPREGAPAWKIFDTVNHGQNLTNYDLTLCNS